METQDANPPTGPNQKKIKKLYVNLDSEAYFPHLILCLNESKWFFSELAKVTKSFFLKRI